jgi:type IV pilus assembly protein PilO
MINLEELKNLNPKTPGAWPWPAKMITFGVIFILVVLAGFLLDNQDQLASLSKAKAQETLQKDLFMSKKKQTVNLDLIRKQLVDTRESFGALLKQLPNKSEMDALLRDINQAGLGHGLQFDLFRPIAETIKGSFAEQPIAISVTGSYDDLGKFASDISMLPRIVTLNNIGITVSGATPGILAMSATAKTFRYLDESELPSQKKSAKPAEVKK